MTFKQRVVTLLASLAVVATALLVVGSPAQAFPDGCRELSPWAQYRLTSVILTTNRFYVEGCGIHTVTDLDVIYVRDSHNVGQCAYFRVELFYSDGRSAGAYSMNGPWTWQLICDDDYPQPLLDHVEVGTKYDVQVTPMPGEPSVPLWLGNFLD
jgi:hypothetical protein